jgi:formylglycine-generating enzyme required for sulfatase activity
VTPFYNRSTDDGTLGTLAWYAPNSGNQTHPVGAKIANALGFSDMLGNVSEWVSDWYGTYPPGTRTDPTGPATGTQRVIRGGAWYPGAAYVRCSDRDDVPPANTDIVIGFRVARNP